MEMNLGTISPSAAKVIHDAETKAAAAAEAVALTRQAVQEGILKIESILADRAKVLAELEALRKIESGDGIKELRQQALNEYLMGHVGAGDVYAAARFRDGAAWISQIEAVRPIVPDAIKEREAAVSAMDKQLVEIARDTHLDGRRIIENACCEPGRGLHSEHHAGRVYWPKS